MEALLKYLHSYIIPNLGIKFIDREDEATNLLSIIDKISVKAWIHVLTGPWGCGKSEFAKALTYALNKTKEYNAIYLDLTEKEVEKFYATTDREIVELVEKIVSCSLGERARIPWYIYRIIRTLHEKRKLKGRRLLLIFDEITYVLGRDRREIEALINSLGQKLTSIAHDMSVEAHSIIITSDQLASEVFTLLSGKYVSNYIMWNLDRDSLEFLSRKLRTPFDIDVLWRITGGNPRALIELGRIHGWDIKKYISSRIEEVRRALRKEAVLMSKERGMTLEAAMKLILEDLDRVMGDLNNMDLTYSWRTLLENNITIAVDARFHKLSRIPKEEWTSERCAFQLPIYYWIVKTMVKRGSDMVTAHEIVKLLSA